MKIIDAHSHLGQCRVFEASQTEGELIAAMDTAGVDASVVQPFPGAPDASKVHDAIAALAGEHQGRIVGMASLTPHMNADDYRTEIRRCVNELGFRAVKVHPIGHAVKPGSAAADLIFSTAAELGIAVMIHTGPGVPFAEPAAWIPMANRYSDTQVILGHAGAHIYTAPAIVAAETCANIVLETSWCNPQDIRGAIARIGAERVLFGSDMAFNIPVALKKYEVLGLPDDQLELVLHRNAERAYGLLPS